MRMRLMELLIEKWKIIAIDGEVDHGKDLSYKLNLSIFVIPGLDVFRIK